MKTNNTTVKRLETFEEYKVALERTFYLAEAMSGVKFGYVTLLLRPIVVEAQNELLHQIAEFEERMKRAFNFTPPAPGYIIVKPEEMYVSIRRRVDHIHKTAMEWMEEKPEITLRELMGVMSVEFREFDEFIEGMVRW